MKQHPPVRFLWLPGLIAVLVAALGLLSGCGLGAAPTPTPAPITLRYVTFPGLAAAEEALIRQYRANHPHVIIAVEPYTQPPDFYLTTDPVPDLMLITPGQFLDTAMASGGLTDLSNLWQEAGAEAALLPSLAALSEREGKQFYLPVGYNWNGFYYNKAIFAQYDLQPPATWDEFTQLCETLWLNGVVPLSATGTDPLMGSLWLDYLNLRLNGAEVQRQLVDGEIPFSDPHIRAALALWADLSAQGYFSENAATMDSLGALAALVQEGNLLGATPAMVLSGPAFLGGLAPEKRTQLGFFPFPRLDANVPPAEVVMAIGYMVPAAAPQRDEALRFAAYLVSAQGRSLLTQDVVASGLYAPAFLSADAAGSDELPETVRQGIALVEQAQSVSPPLSMSLSPTLWPALMDMQRRILSEPASGRGFDLDALLARMEAARNR